MADTVDTATASATGTGSGLPLPRGLVALLNLQFTGSAVPDEARRAALAELAELESSFVSSFPLLDGLDQEGRRAALLEALGRVKLCLAAGTLETLEPTALEFAAAAHRLRELEKRLPALTDDRLFNEVLILGANLVHGRTEDRRALTRRVPALFAMVRDFENALERFRRSRPGLEFPGHEALQGLKMATGGLVAYLEEGRLDDLRGALKLLETSGREAAACLEFMRKVEFEHVRFSEEPVLERLYRLLETGPAEEIPQARAAVLDHHERTVRTGRALLDRLLGQAARERLVAPFARALARLGDASGSLESREGLTEYRDAAVEHYECRRALLEAFEQRPDLSGSAHFSELVAMMDLVHQGRLPVRQLVQKVEQLAGLQQEYRHRLALLASNDAAPVVALLDEQAQALATVAAATTSGDRELLGRAYDQLAAPTRQLIALNQSAREEGLDAYDVEEPVAQTGLSQRFAWVCALVEEYCAGRVPGARALEMIAPYCHSVDELEAALLEADDPGEVRLRETVTELTQVLGSVVTAFQDGSAIDAARLATSLKWLESEMDRLQAG